MSKKLDFIAKESNAQYILRPRHLGRLLDNLTGNLPGDSSNSTRMWSGSSIAGCGQEHFSAGEKYFVNAAGGSPNDPPSNLGSYR